MKFHENRLPLDDAHETSYLIFFQKLGKMSQNLSPAAVLISTLRVKCLFVLKDQISKFCCLLPVEGTTFVSNINVVVC